MEGQGGERIKDYRGFLSHDAKLLAPSPIRMLVPMLKIPGMISLGGGLPNTGYFPFEEVNVKLKDGASYSINGPDLETALTYTPSYGIPELVNWLKNYQEKEHRPQYATKEDWHVCVTTGSSDAGAKAFRMLIDRDDYVLVENPTYSGALSGLRPLTKNLVGVNTDQFGLIPEHLAQVLDSWPQDKKKPRVLYIIPTGQNPSGSTLSSERRGQVYNIACKHNLIILEDDPYYQLRLEPGKPPASFLSLDTQGRVIRFDSFSKVVSSGLRIGWATGPMPLIETMQLDQQITAMHPSGVSQMVLLKLLEKWGDKGLEDHLHFIREGYKKRRDAIAASAQKHLVGLAEWHVPDAGMFLWFKVLGVKSTEQLIKERAVAQKVLFVPGSAFTPYVAEKQADGSEALVNPASPYVRASFSVASEADMDEALRRFAVLLREEATRV